MTDSSGSAGSHEVTPVVLVQAGKTEACLASAALAIFLGELDLEADIIR